MPWSSERVVHSSLQAEANRLDSVVAAAAALVAESQGSSFPSQESESVTIQVRSYPSQVQQVVTRQDHKSGSETS